LAREPRATANATCAVDFDSALVKKPAAERNEGAPDGSGESTEAPTL
jgi:hypothetical protein